MPASTHAAQSAELANFLGRGESAERLHRIDEQLALAAVVSFAGRLKAHCVERVDLERVRWREDGAHVELLDGAVLVVDVLERDRQCAPTVALQHLHRLGDVVKTGALAEQWLEAHESLLVESWNDHCRAER